MEGVRKGREGRERGGEGSVIDAINNPKENRNV